MTYHTRTEPMKAGIKVRKMKIRDGRGNYSKRGRGRNLRQTIRRYGTAGEGD